MAVRDWLIEIRKARGLTQKYVAEQAGISQPLNQPPFSVPGI